MLAGTMKLSTFVALVAGSVVGFATAKGLDLATGPWVHESALADARLEGARAADEECAARLATMAAAVPAAAAPAVESAASPGATADVQPPADQPWFADVVGFRGKSIGSEKLKDATKGKAWKVNVYQDAGKSTANRAKVDLDRDDKWDEKWTFEEGKVTREVAPSDDETYSETWTWTGGAWSKG